VSNEGKVTNGNGDQQRSAPATGSGDAPASAVAVLETPAVEDFGYEDGLYEMWLTPDCPVASRYIPCIEYVDEETGRTRTTGFNVVKSRKSHALSCTHPACSHRWEPEFPLRPADVLARSPDLLRRFKESHYCAKCRKQGRRSRGQNTVKRGHVPVGKDVPMVVWLSGKERKAIDDYLDPERKAIPHYEERLVPGTAGEKVRLQVGFKQQPAMVSYKDDAKVMVTVPLAKFVRIAPTVDAEAVGDEFMNMWAEVQGRVSKLVLIISREDRALDEMRRTGRPKAEVARQQQKVDRLVAERDSLLDRLKVIPSAPAPEPVP